MSLTDSIKKSCIHCSYEDSLKAFGTWERDGKRGFQGKTPDGHMMLLCPKCEGLLKYDPLSNRFLREDESSSSGMWFNLALLVIVGLALYACVKLIK